MDERRRQSDQQLEFLIKLLDERHKELKEDIGGLGKSHATLTEAATKVNTIFGKDGPWDKLSADVSRHNRYETGAKTVFGIGGFIGFGTIVEWFRNHAPHLWNK